MNPKHSSERHFTKDRIKREADLVTSIIWQIKRKLALSTDTECVILRPINMDYKEVILNSLPCCSNSTSNLEDHLEHQIASTPAKIPLCW